MVARNPKLVQRHQNVLNLGVVANLLITVLQQRSASLENKRSSLTQGVFDISGSQVLNTNVVGSSLIGFSQSLERCFIVACHHVVDGRWIPHGLEALIKAQYISNCTAVVTKTQGWVNAKLLGKFGCCFSGTDTNKEKLTGWEHLLF